MAATTEVSISRLQAVMHHIVRHSLGYVDPTEAKVIVDILMYAQIRGNSQGAIKLITDGVPRSHPDGRNLVTTEFETKLSARLNGNGMSGMLLMNTACELAVKKAQEHGFGIVATHGTSSGTGAIGYFGMSIARRGLLGFVLSQSPEFVAPFGSYEPIFGTNPFSIGIPTKDADHPIVLDMATSAIAWFNVKQAKTAGVSIPDDVAYDVEGKPTTDPAEALKGALRVFDRSYKGSHIALMIEILAGPLAGGDVEDKLGRGNWGNLVFVIDPELLGPADEFKDKVEVLVERVKGAKKLPGVEDIWLPGERSEKAAAEVLARGSVQLERNMWEGLLGVYRATGGREEGEGGP